MVSQPRQAIGKQTWEIPAGKLEYGENPKECGIRELNEETGYECSSFDYFTSFYSTPGFCDEKIYLFQAKDPTPVKNKLDQDKDENVTHQWFDLEKVKEMLKRMVTLKMPKRSSPYNMAIKKKGYLIMNFVFISPNYPDQYWMFCRGLKKYGATVFRLLINPTIHFLMKSKNLVMKFMLLITSITMTACYVPLVSLLLNMERLIGLNPIMKLGYNSMHAYVMTLM